MRSILTLKDKKIAPSTSLRMVLLHPPYLNSVGTTNIGAYLAEKYAMNYITLLREY